MPRETSVVSSVIPLAYLAAACMFIVGIKWMNSPVTARRGNRLSALGMTLAVVMTLLEPSLWNPNPALFGTAALHWLTIGSGIAVGSVVGYAMAKRVKMTDMPQIVAIFNGMGGGAAAAVSSATFLNLAHGTANESPFSILVGTVIGSITFAGSMVAFGKLQGLISGRAITFPGQRIVQVVVALVVLMLCGFILAGHLEVAPFTGALVLSIILGVFFVLPIGGADMPVVISLLNSFTGTAAAFTGFVLQNNVLIIAGALVGASGFILTTLMCRAMNRSLGHVLFGRLGPKAGAAAAAVDGSIQETTVDDVAIMLAYARNVIIIPGYGLAVAQAQHAVQELAEVLEKRGVSIKYAIHPVAGRMPGHMNVLLAEANVPYSLLCDMDDINPEFEKADVALIIGANDVTNPAARSDPTSPIYGMPILDVDHAKNIVVMKRSMAPGFAGIDNLLYFNPRCKMLFGDAKKSVTALISEVQSQ
jgi:H+-translocating NAD(P) transhydrogenase subunit beta